VGLDEVEFEHPSPNNPGALPMPKTAPPKRMTAAEITAIRGELGWTQDQLGRAINLPPKNAGRTIRRYEGGRRIPGPVEIAVRAIKDGFSPPHVEAIRAEAKA
jgi:DNA-binding XRE family transcriptional regulator